MGARTLRDLICEIAGAGRKELDGDRWWREWLRWPPDVFAVTSVFLASSGAYRMCVSPPPGCTWDVCGARTEWTRGVERRGAAWFRCVATRKRLPSLWADCADVRAVLDVVVARLGKADEIAQHDDLRRGCLALLRLHGSADVACAGLGVPARGKIEETDSPEEEQLSHAEFLLAYQGSLSSYEADRIRVLPKLRTPQIGITLRSLSHHVAVHRSEIDVTWRLSHAERLGLLGEERRMNLLVIPWPFEIEACHYAPKLQPDWTERPTDFAAFVYDPPEDPAGVAEMLTRALAATDKRQCQVHGVVLPECALSEAEYEAAKDALTGRVSLFLAGVRGKARNEARLALWDKVDRAEDGTLVRAWTDVVQPKHHRWCLDRAQIHNYHLGATLHPVRRYWEHIEVKERTIEFVALSDWLTLCHLICEDLARQDPVSDIIRAVGPNLVVALLMDGPQLESRWPGRYASVLADDPGSSVLTVSSLGMVRRSQGKGMPPSRTVALWKDARRGTQELTLERDAKALHLSLSGIMVEEWTADGRSDGGFAGQIELSAVEQITW